MYRKSAAFLATTLTLFAAGTNLGQEHEAKRFYAARQGAPVWSTSEEGRYLAAQLASGAPVDAYQRQGDWLAIRPPQGCFSWVPETAVRPTDEPNQVEVVLEGAQSWIGGMDPRSAPQRPQSLIQLRRGEKLFVLGRWDLTAPSGRIVESWLRVSPPSGEFRWMHRDDVASAPPSSEWLSSKPTATPESIDRDQTDAPATRRASFEASSQGEGPDHAARPATQVASDPPENPGESGDGVAAAQWTNRDRASTTDATAQRDAPDRDRGEARAAERWKLPQGVDFSEQLSALQLQFSKTVTLEPDAWRLEPLRSAAESLIATGQSALQRGQARRVLEEIRSMEHLQQRHRRLHRKDLKAAGRSRSETGDASLRRASAEKPVARPESIGEGERSGVLLEVQSRSGAAPPYALVDDQGQLLCLLTPSPGVDLRAHVRQRVAVEGTAVSVTNLNTQHVTVRRVRRVHSVSDGQGG